MSPEDCGDL